MGYRARIADMTTFTAPRPLVAIVGSGTSGFQVQSLRCKLAARNNIYLNYKNMPLLQLAVNLLPILLEWDLSICF
ncbi:MAG: hypothetical protein ACLR0U_27220 [Enterocloster clostridioformis]